MATALFADYLYEWFLKDIVVLSWEFTADIIHAQFISSWPDSVCSGKFVCSFTEVATPSLDEKNLALVFFPPFHLFSFSSVGYLGHNPQFVLSSHLLWK